MPYDLKRGPQDFNGERTSKLVRYDLQILQDPGPRLGVTMLQPPINPRSAHHPASSYVAPDGTHRDQGDLYENDLNLQDMPMFNLNEDSECPALTELDIQDPTHFEHQIEPKLTGKNKRSAASVS